MSALVFAKLSNVNSAALISVDRCLFPDAFNSDESHCRPASNFLCLKVGDERHQQINFWVAMSWYFKDWIKIVLINKYFPIFTNIMKRISRILTFRSYRCSLENRHQSCSRRKLKAKQLDSVTRKRWKICRNTVKNHKWVMQFTERMLLNTFTNQLRRSCKSLSHKTSRQIAAVYCLHFLWSSPCRSKIVFTANTRQASFSSVGWGYCRSPRLMRNRSIEIKVFVGYFFSC